MKNNNKKLPPHLPPPSCNVDLFHKLEKTKLVFYVAIIALVAGVAGSLSALAWLTPDFYTTQGTWQTIGGRSTDSTYLDPVFVRQVKQKMLTIYDTRRLPGNFLVDEARVAEAVFLSSDGWAAAYYPAYILGEEKNWEVIGDQGVILRTSNAVYDRVSKIIFFKVQGQGFRFAAVTDWRNFDHSRDLGVFENKKSFASRLAERKYAGDNRSFAAHVPQYFDSLEVSALPGSSIFDLNGNLVGFVDSAGHVLPSLAIDVSLSKILEGKSNVNTVFNWHGVYVTGEKTNGTVRELSGFLLTEAPIASSGLKKGDLVVSVNGHDLVEDNLAWDILSASDPSDVVVVRGGERLVISVKKNLIP